MILRHCLRPPDAVAQAAQRLLALGPVARPVPRVVVFAVAFGGQCLPSSWERSRPEGGPKAGASSLAPSRLKPSLLNVDHPPFLHFRGRLPHAYRVEEPEVQLRQRQRQFGMKRMLRFHLDVSACGPVAHDEERRMPKPPRVSPYKYLMSSLAALGWGAL